MAKNYFHIPGKFLMVLIGVGISFFILEIGLRFYNYSWYQLESRVIDERTGLRILKPDQEIRFRGECYDNIVKTNSLGFHSREYTVEKPENVFRIVILGDSFLEGAQVPLKSTFAYLLEEKLNNYSEKKYQYEVIPFGISGRGTFLNLLYYKYYAMQYQPDLVIDSFLVFNDLLEDYVNNPNPPELDENGKVILELPSENHKNLSAASVYESIKKLLMKSQLILTVYQRMQTFIQRNISDTDLGYQLDKEIFLIEYPEIWQRAWALEDSMLSMFNHMSEQNNAKFLLISLAEGFRVHDTLFDMLGERYKDQTAFDYEKPERLLADIAERSGFMYFPLLPYFKEKAVTEHEISVWPCDSHWNETGHRWAAEAIYDYLINNKNLIER